MCVTQAGKRHLNDSKLYRVMFISPSYHMDGWNGGGIETMEEGTDRTGTDRTGTIEKGQMDEDAARMMPEKRRTGRSTRC